MGYFEAKNRVLDAAAELYTIVGDNIEGRDNTYSRAAFYADAAEVIEALVDMGASPFGESSENWLWWAGECRNRAAELGDDKKFIVKLPPPDKVGDYLTYEKVTNSLDGMVSLMLSLTKQEEEDDDISDLGNLTPAECVKLTHRFAHYWIGKGGGNRIGYVVDWKWVPAVVAELKAIYRQLGEKDRAGSSGEPVGPIPPISWPSK